MRLGSIGDSMTASGATLATPTDYASGQAFLRAMGWFTNADTTPDFAYWAWAYQLSKNMLATGAASSLSDYNLAMYYGAPPEVVRAATTPNLTQADLLALSDSFCKSYPCGTSQGQLYYTGQQFVPNALNYSAPTQTTVSPMPPTNVLTPPTAQQTPTQQQIANGMTVTGGTLSNMPAAMSGAVTWAESNMGLIAAGVAAVFLLPMLMGGRK